MALTNKLSAIGDAVREKTGKQEKLTLDAMVTEIQSIQTGGGSGGGSVDEAKLEKVFLRSKIGTVLHFFNKYLKEHTEIGQYQFSTFDNTYDVMDPITADDLRSLDLSHLQKIGDQGLQGMGFDHGWSSKKGTDPQDTDLTDRLVKPANWTININDDGISNNSLFTNRSLSYDVVFNRFGGNDRFKEFTAIITFPKVIFANIDSYDKRGAFKNNNLMLAGIFPKLKIIPRNAFESCSNCAYLDFGAAEKFLSNSPYDSPFMYNYKLRTVIFRNPNKVVECPVNVSDMFAIEQPHFRKTAADTIGRVYVPKALLEQYKSATNWVTIADRILAIEDHPEECNLANYTKRPLTGENIEW